VRVLLVAPDVSTTGSAPGSAADALDELGSRFVAVGLDLAGLDDQLERPPTLVVIDTPDRLVTGAGVLRRLRAHPALLRVPVVVVVSPKQIVELDPELSPDDVIMSPVHPHELYTRMRLLDFRHASFQHPSRLQRGDLVVDFDGYEARLRGRPLQLTRREFELLRFLAQNPGRAYTREQLLARAWDGEYAGGVRTVDVHIRRLRAKLGLEHESLIQTVRRMGYRFRAEGEEEEGLEAVAEPDDEDGGPLAAGAS
jgi:DNA-binding response OmpR family regulator